MTVLVTGATGFVGRALVPALLAEGEQVRAASRRPERPGVLPRPPPQRELTWVRCDVSDLDGVRAALRGVDCAYYLVHAMRGGKGDFRDVERQCAHNFVRAAEESGCRRIVYLGGVAPRGRPSRHLASRLAVGEILRSGRVPTIELRASMIVGNGSVSWTMVRDLAVRLPVMILPRWLESRSRPIALEDAVRALLDARRVRLERSDWFDIPGPDELSAREMLRAVGRLRGWDIPMIPVPLLTPRLSALWLRLVTGAPYEVARELVLGLTEDLLPRDERFFEATGHWPRVGFEQAAREALDAEGPNRGMDAAITRWKQRLGSLRERLGSAARSARPG